MTIPKAKNGIWEIEPGKGDRVYIYCTDENKIIHPEHLCEALGLGIYGYEHLKSLAVAILQYEKAVQDSESIANAVNNERRQS